MIVATIDFARKKIKLSSFLRDMYIPIENHGNNRLNAAYAFGGAPLAIKTFNQNFGLDIRDYVAVNFYSLEKAIDAFGGVDVYITDAEANEMNNSVIGSTQKKNGEPISLASGGKQHLSGAQAVAYARIRKIGNGDWERVERQRAVVVELIRAGEEAGISAVPELVNLLHLNALHFEAEASCLWLCCSNGKTSCFSLP